jgi:hypothetical protein
MQMGSGVSVLFGQSKINDIDLVSSFAKTHEEIVWLDVSVEDLAFVQMLNSIDHLLADHQYSLE